MNTLLDVIDGAEESGSDSYNAPHCPNCGRGEDRLVIWPESGETGRVWCRHCDWGRRGHPDGSIDGIEYLRRVEGMSFREACDFFGVEKEVKGDTVAQTENDSTDSVSIAVSAPPEDTSSTTWTEYEPPPDAWRDAAKSFCAKCKNELWSDSAAGRSAREYLHGRGLNDETIRAAGLGANTNDKWPAKREWGLEEEGKVWLPRGVVIPWGDGDGISGVNIRRPSGDIEPEAEEQWKRRKYQRATGPSAPMYGVQWIHEPRPVVLVEGEFDALAVQQQAADICFPVATGSTGGARRERWRQLLANAPLVLVSFDSEEAGEGAAREWISALPNAVRWHPHATDTSDMLEEGKDLRMWVRCGIQAARRSL